MTPETFKMLVKLFVAVINDWSLSDWFRWYCNRNEKYGICLIFDMYLMLFSILYVLFYFSTALLVLHVATLQLRKYSFLNYKKPVLDPWSYLQPPGTLGEKISSQNSRDGRPTVLTTSNGRNCGHCFWYFLSQTTLNKQGSSKIMNHHPSRSLEKETRDVSVIMKYQQDQLILRALMYCVNPTMYNAPKWSDTL